MNIFQVISNTKYLFLIRPIFVGLGFTILVASCGQETCRDFKTGTFLYNPQTAGIPSFDVMRVGTIQTEINRSTGDSSTLAVTWLDDCTYTLRIIESDVVYPDSLMKMMDTTVVKTTILSWTSDYYIFESQSNVSNHI
jgi:hypothetical protein